MPANEEAPGRATEGNSNSTCEGINLHFDDTGQQLHKDSNASIDARGAPMYRQAGWLAPLPFPPGEKHPPPKGYTGYDGLWPDDGQIDRWARGYSRLSNLALRVE